jgi:hypothetical protein
MDRWCRMVRGEVMGTGKKRCSSAKGQIRVIEQLTRYCTVYNCPVFELYRDRLVIELHQESTGASISFPMSYHLCSRLLSILVSH